MSTRACFICGRTLSDDPRLVHMALDVEAMEEHGVNDVSELINEPVIVELCDVCGVREQAPTVQQLRDSEKKRPQ